MECTETPDSGASAGASGDWNEVDRYYLTNFTYTCPFGE